MKFYASIKPLIPLGPPPTLILEAPSALDARAWAMREFAQIKQRSIESTEFMFQSTGEDAVADVELRWVGGDAGPGASGTNGRRMESRRRGKGGAWGEWQ